MSLRWRISSVVGVLSVRAFTRAPNNLLLSVASRYVVSFTRPSSSSSVSRLIIRYPCLIRSVFKQVSSVLSVAKTKKRPRKNSFGKKNAKEMPTTPRCKRRYLPRHESRWRKNSLQVLTTRANSTPHTVAYSSMKPLTSK